MVVRKWSTEDDGTVHAVLIVFVLVVSALAGRQFFMDGTNFIVSIVPRPPLVSGRSRNA